MRLNRQAGLTYLELLIAAAIIGVAFAPLLGLYQSAARASFDASKLTVATLIAQSRIEELRSLPFDDVQGWTREVVSQTPGYESFASFEWEGAVSTIGSRLKHVAIRIYWTGIKGEMSAELETLIGRR